MQRERAAARIVAIGRSMTKRDVKDFMIDLAIILLMGGGLFLWTIAW